MATAATSSPTPSCHEHQLQLFAICSIGQYGLQQLLKYFASLKNPGITPGQSLSLIFTNRKLTIKNKCGNIFRNSGLIRTIYKDFNNDVFNPSIDVSKFDISTLNDIFRNVEDFETSSVNRRTGWTCKDPNHVNGGNNKRVCCQNCWRCLDCVLKANATPTWQELFEKGIVVKPVNPNFVCPMLLLRLSIRIVGLFRNITMHLTETKCREMDINQFYDQEVPNFTSWSKVRDALYFAVHNILDFLHSSGYISSGNKQRQVEAMRIIDVSFSLSNFGNAIENFLQLESHTAATEQLNSIQSIIKEIKTFMRSLSNLKVQVRISFEEETDFHLYSPEAFIINAAFKHASERYFFGQQIKTSMVSAKPVEKTSFEERNVIVKFKITSALVSFTEYENSMTDPSQRLWEEIETVFQDFIPQARIRLYSWDVGSIVIKISLCKENGNPWSEVERLEISSCLTEISQQLERFLPRTQCDSEMLGQKQRTMKDEIQSNMFEITFCLHAAALKFAEREFETFNKERMVGYFKNALGAEDLKYIKVSIVHSRKTQELLVPASILVHEIKIEFKKLTKLLCKWIKKRKSIKEKHAMKFWRNNRYDVYEYGYGLSEGGHFNLRSAAKDIYYMMLKEYEKIFKSLQVFCKLMEVLWKSHNLEGDSGRIVHIFAEIVVTLARLSEKASNTYSKPYPFDMLTFKSRYDMTFKEDFGMKNEQVKDLTDGMKNDQAKDLTDARRREQAKAIYDWLDQDLPSENEIRMLLMMSEDGFETFIQEIEHLSKTERGFERFIEEIEHLVTEFQEILYRCSFRATRGVCKRIDQYSMTQAT